MIGNVEAGATRRPELRLARIFLVAPALLLLALSAGCTAKDAVPATSDPNVVPPKYREQIATFLSTELLDRSDFRGALIAAPALKPVETSQRMVVCLQFNGHNVRKNKVVIYYGGSIQQFVDPTPQQCADAVYQPFRELEQLIPDR